MRASINNELVAYSYSILSVAEVENNQLVMPDALAENQFNTSESGLYAAISSKDKSPQTLWRSASLLAIEMPAELISPNIGDGRFYTLMLDGIEHFVYSFSVSFTDEQFSNEFTLHIIKQQNDYLTLMNDFTRQLWLGLMLLMAVLLLIQFIWLKWSLRPLALLKSEIAEIERGKANLLRGEYPEELQPVKEQLNTLLVTEQSQRKRYRNALSDLAHSLKTPLAVLQGLVGETGDKTNANKQLQGQDQIDVMNLMIEHQLKRAQSAGQSSWHLGAEINPVLTKLLNSLKKIYRDKQLNYHVNITKAIVFKGDEADLLEVLGNLLDNASKAAKHQIHITITEATSTIKIEIEDDGVGIDESKISEILQRGTRADTYQQGHGIGLAIVRDLVDSYHGSLAITQSEGLGGAKFSVSFPC